MELQRIIDDNENYPFRFFQQIRKYIENGTLDFSSLIQEYFLFLFYYLFILFSFIYFKLFVLVIHFIPIHFIQIIRTTIYQDML